MNDFYQLGWENKKEYASACAPESTIPEHELISDLESTSELPFALQLVKLSVNKSGIVRTEDLTGLSSTWLDYQSNSLEWPFMSIKLKEIVNENLTGDEGIDWVLAKVNGPGGYRNYYIPRFERKLDVLDSENTRYTRNSDSKIRPHFSLGKINQYSIFHLQGSNDQWKITSGLYVNFLLKKAIRKNRLTGMTFERVAVQ
jgi:hypothetical protein